MNGEGVRKKGRKVRFANSTEERFAQLLRRLRLRWQYEPHMFVLRVKSDGTPALAFTPDFYLPDLQMYFELTTLRQELVTLKNRKARLLQEQRPDVRLRLLYRRDCQELLRPVRSRRAREQVLRRLLPSPTEDVLRRAGWLLRLSRTGDSAGRVSVLGVRLPLGPEWAGRKLLAWVYPGAIEIEWEDTLVARFPCSYDAVTRTLRWVLPGELMYVPEYEQARLSLPELEPVPVLGRRGERSLRVHSAVQLPLPL